MTKSKALAGTPSMTTLRNRVPVPMTASSTRKAATSAGAQARTGRIIRTATATAVSSDWRSVSSAAPRSPAPTWRATIASAPIPRANITASTAPRIWTPTPTAATAVRPSRPTISMSQRPTNDSMENEKMTGHASAHVARRNSASGARPASAATGMERARAIPSPVAAPSIAARVSRAPNEGQRARLHDRARASGRSLSSS